MQTKPGRTTKYRMMTEQRILSIVSLLLALLFTRIRIHGDLVPFALALLYASVLCELLYPWTTAGVVIGCMIGTPSWYGAATATLFALAVALLRLWKPSPSKRILAILFAIAGAATLPLTSVYDTWGPLFGALSIPIAFAAGHCIARALTTLKGIRETRLFTEWDQNTLLLLWTLCVLGCSELKAGELSFSLILILFTTMVLTQARGLYGSFAASLLSATWVLYADADARVVAVVTLGAALSIPFCRDGRLWIIASHFAAALLLIGMQPEGLSPMLIWNTVTASMLFALTPQAIIRRIISLTAIDKTVAKNARTALLRAQKRTAASLSEMGAFLKEVSDTFEPGETESSVAEWTVQGALVICLNCAHHTDCWRRALDARETVMELAERLDRAEPVIPIDPFRPDCPTFRDLCGSILLAYQQALTHDAVLHRMRRESYFSARAFRGAGDAVNRLAMAYRSGYGYDRSKEAAILKALLQAGFDTLTVEVLRHADAALMRITLAGFTPKMEEDILRCVGEAIGWRVRLLHTEQQEDGTQLLLEPAPRWRVEMAVSQHAMAEQAPGDSFGELRVRGGKSLFALSDGMGSGRQAAGESSAAIGTLFRLYDSGMERELVLENVNRILMRRSREDVYATLDAVSFDLNKGTAELLKFGSPPSYLLRGRTLYALTGEALPCGIVEDVKPTVIPLRFDRGDVLLLCTDGVTDALQDRLEAILLEHAGKADAAERIANAARDTGYRDDQSVMVLKVTR